MRAQSGCLRPAGDGGSCGHNGRQGQHKVRGGASAPPSETKWELHEVQEASAGTQAVEERKAAASVLRETGVAAAIAGGRAAQGQRR